MNGLGTSLGKQFTKMLKICKWTLPSHWSTPSVCTCSWKNGVIHFCACGLLVFTFSTCLLVCAPHLSRVQ